MTAEQWRLIVGCPGYEVSNQGRVVSHRGGRPRLLRPTPNQNGYLLVGLVRADGHRISRTIHRLVGDAFLGPCPDGMETCHDDGDKTNNAASNLRFDTKSANALDRVRHGTDRNARKTHCPADHEYTPENTYILPSRPTARYCLACRKDYRARARRAVGIAA